jgi:hypothetical protein
MEAGEVAYYCHHFEALREEQNLASAEIICCDWRNLVQHEALCPKWVLGVRYPSPSRSSPHHYLSRRLLQQG